MSEAVETLLLNRRCLKLDRSDSAVSRFQQDLSERSDRWPAIIDLANAHYLITGLAPKCCLVLRFGATRTKAAWYGGIRVARLALM